MHETEKADDANDRLRMQGSARGGLEEPFVEAKSILNSIVGLAQEFEPSKEGR